MRLSIHGSLGDTVAATAIPREYQKHHPGHLVSVVCNYPELFQFNPHVGVGTVDDGVDGGLPLAPDNSAGNLVHAYAKYIGIKAYDTQPEVFLSEDERAAYKVPAGSIAIDTWAGWPSRRWPLERWVELAERFKRLGYHIIEVGASTSDCFGGHRPPSTPWANESYLDRCTVRQTASIISNCQVLMGGDSGLAHLAAAVNTRSVVLFSVPWYSRAYRTTYPVFDPRAVCTDCRGAVAHGGNCLDSITIEDVWQVAQVALGLR